MNSAHEISPDYATPFRVTDLKQWVYCPRILYYQLCLPEVRPITYKMEAGIEAGREEEQREGRRSLKAYGLSSGRREFNVSLVSDRYGLRGKADLVIWVEPPQVEEVIPVDFKMSEMAGEHFKLQLVAYGLILEEVHGVPARRGFLYEIPLKQVEEVNFTDRLRQRFLAVLEEMRHMLWTEEMPAPTPNLGKCLACEFRRFCNDVI